MQELLFKSILNPLPASETANAQRLLMYRNRNQKSGDDNKKSGDDKFEKRPQRAPPPNLDVASLTTRWESCAQKDSFFSLPYSSDSYSVHRIGSCRNQKIGDDKFERRPWRVPPPNLDVASLTRRWELRAQKDSFFFPFLQLRFLQLP
jgi:hypothetical protein